MAKINVLIIKEFLPIILHKDAWWILVSPSGIIISHWNLMALISPTFKIIA
jgi:hypothetical protein